MVTIVQPPQPRLHWAEALATGLGTGLSQLAHQKMNEMVTNRLRKEKAEAFRTLRPDLTPEQARAITFLPENLYANIFQQQPEQYMQGGVQEGAQRPIIGPTQEQQEKRQQAIERQSSKYRDTLDKRYVPSEEIIRKGSEMLDLLDRGDVDSGFSGTINKRIPFLQSSDSQRFEGLGDDIASALSGLTTGVQTISKIKFNKERKAHLGLKREAQYARTEEAIKEASLVALEKDIVDWLMEQNNNRAPRNLEGQAQKIYKRISKVPPKPINAQDGEIFNDPQTGVQWIVQGPILRFNGLIGAGYGK